MKKEEKIKVGISVGDLNGVGIEVILKTFEDSRMLEFCTPIVFGSSKSVSFHKKALGIETGIHGVDHVFKGATGHRFIVGPRLGAGLMRIGAGFALKGDAFGHFGHFRLFLAAWAFGRGNYTLPSLRGSG